MKHKTAYRILRTAVWMLVWTISSILALADTGKHDISRVEKVVVNVQEGHAPMLPYRLWVTYNDGTSEWRQVRWTNSSLKAEEELADKQKHPAGTNYEVKGFITGDMTTGNGFPVTAQVLVTDKPAPTPSPKPVAEPLPLNKVTIDGDNRLTWNRDLDIDQLLSLDVSQQLYNYRDTYGLPTDGYTVSDGWDSPTTKLKGHGSGHYMSAMAMAYACCTDKEKKQQLLQNITRMVDELRQCQERTFVYDEQLGRYREARDFAPEAELRQMKGSWADFDNYKKDYSHYGYGYLNAIPAHHCALIEMYRPYNNDQWVWAPYYSVHKQLAGLIDIATYVDDRRVAAKALLIAKDMGLWVWNRLHYRTFVKSDGTQEERRSQPGNRHEMWNMYIAGEVGGMAESLARLSEMTADATEKARLLEAANAFDSPAFFGPLVRGIDDIRTRHANQHIPMVTGALRSYRGNANSDYYLIAKNFWNMIQGRYRYAMGGVGNGEMFRQPYSQITSLCSNVTNRPQRGFVAEPTMNETCCAYNLAKLTKDLNCFTPDDARLMDYYERVLYNQIVGSVNPRRYQTVYQYAVGVNASKPWGNTTPQATCCGGTGVENHVKYQEAAYFTSENTLWVGLYLPTTAIWDNKHVTIRQECSWPAEHSTLRIVRGKARFAMKLRVPYWATKGFDIRLNGQSLQQHYQPSSYVEIPMRRWTTKDVVEVIMPFGCHIDYCPDKMTTAPKDGKMAAYEPMWTGALMYGPLVMAATDIHNWEEAVLNMPDDLDSVTLNGAGDGKGADAHLYTLTCAGRTFIPDYHADRHITHYLRLNYGHGNGNRNVDSESQMTVLRELMEVAAARIAEQEAWQQQPVKVSPDAPWASHGYSRMKALFDQAKVLLEGTGTNGVSPDAPNASINQTVTGLNTIINTMRPGNLPELEDLEELNALLVKARNARDASSAARQDAIDYAEMVVSYVSDGSGTRDMIDRAVKQLKATLEVRR